jgi:hypothetical protein
MVAVSRSFRLTCHTIPQPSQIASGHPNLIQIDNESLVTSDLMISTKSLQILGDKGNQPRYYSEKIIL